MELEVKLTGPGPWGFRVTGGREQGAPLSVCKLISSGKAAEANVRENDVITKINGKSTDYMSIADASNEIRNATDLCLSLTRRTNYFNPGSPSKGKDSSPWQPAQSSSTMRSSSSVTITLSRNERTSNGEKQKSPSHSTSVSFQLQNPPVTGDVIDSSNVVMSEDQLAEVQRKLDDLSTFYIKPKSIDDVSPGKKDLNDNVAYHANANLPLQTTVPNQPNHVIDGFPPEAEQKRFIPHLIRQSPHDQSSYGAKTETFVSKAVISPSMTSPPYATYEDVHSQKSETSEPQRDFTQRPRSAFSDPYTRPPQPFSKQTSQTYKPVVIRSPLSKAHLFTCSPEDADVESVASGESSRGTPTIRKEDIVREPQFQPMKSPTRVPGYYGRLQYEAKSRDLKTLANSQTSPRDDTSSYFSDGEVFKPRYTRSRFSRAPVKSRKSPLNSSTWNPNEMQSNSHTRSRTRRNELPQSSLNSGYVVHGNQYYSDAEDQSSVTPRHRAAWGSRQYYSDAEDSAMLSHSNQRSPNHPETRKVVNGSQYYSDIEEPRRRYISRRSPQIPSSYFSDTEGQSGSHGNRMFVSPSNYRYCNSEEPTHGYVSQCRDSQFVENQRCNDTDIPAQPYPRYTGSNYYSDTEGYQSRRKFVPPNSRHSNNPRMQPMRATGEVIRKPQFQPKMTPPKMPKYYEKIYAMIGEDTSIAMSDTEAISPTYSRRRRTRRADMNEASSREQQPAGNFSDYPTVAWSESPELTSSRHGHEHFVRSSSEGPLFMEVNDMSANKLSRYTANPAGQTHTRYHSDMEAPRINESQSNHLFQTNSNPVTGHKHDFHDHQISPTNRNAASTSSRESPPANVPYLSKHTLSAMEKSISAKSESGSAEERTDSANRGENGPDHRSKELFQKYFGSIEEYERQNKAVNARYAPATYSGPWIPKSQRQSENKTSTDNAYSSLRRQGTGYKPQPLKLRVGVDKDSPVYNAVHEDLSPSNAKPGEVSSRYMEDFEDDEIQYHDYVDKMVQSPTFLRLNRILEEDEDK